MGENKGNFKIKAARLIVAGAVFVAFSGSALADRFDDQIRVLQQQAAAAQAAARAARQQAGTYQARVNELNAQINAVLAQIALNEAKSEQLAAQVEATKQKLLIEKDRLDENLRQFYIVSQTTTLEALLSSESLDDFFDRQISLQTVKDHIALSIDNITQFKVKLEDDQGKVRAILAEQRAQNAQINAQRAEVAGLLALALEDQAAANAQVRTANSQIANLRAAQAAMFAQLRLTGSDSGSVGSLQFRNAAFGGQCGGGYPSDWCNSEQDSLVDSWGMYNRECVSFTAWAVVYRSGRRMPYWGGRGNAYQWPSSARSDGIAVDGHPTPGSVAIASQAMVGGVGHAMYVEDVLGGGWIRVSQYNWWPSSSGPSGIYSVMEVKADGLEFIHF
jgi:surface antigen